MKTSIAGQSCPEWCAEGHQAEKGMPWCESAIIGTSSAHAEIQQHAPDSPAVTAWVVGKTTAADCTARRLTARSNYEAQRIADALDIIAGMRKPEIRALAKNVREAAAQAWPEREAEAS